jgi:UDP-glucose:(glucosyl)LPS alpha-1,2-glucosyltransferase
MEQPRVAMVLPPREGFAPDAVGAIGLLVHRLAARPGRFAPDVVGMQVQAPFADVAFRAARLAWIPARQATRYAAGVARLLCRLRPALIEVHNRPDVALFLASRFPAIPVCLFLHNDPQGMRAAGSPAERATLLARLAQVVTVSGFLRERLLEGVANPAPDVAVLPNCLDLRAVPPPPPTRDQVILFAGRMVADKGADSFVAACARALPDLPGWRAEMIGADRFSPDSPQTRWLRALLPRAEAAGIVLRGYLPHAEVLAAMSRAAIVVVPSRWPEPFGMTALEALATGAALLCAPRGGLAEVVGDAAVRIDPDDVAGMADAIVALARDGACRAGLGEVGRARARRFDVELAGAALDALRGDVLAAWPCPAAAPI